MSAAMGSVTEVFTVYVRLLNEGTLVYRPTRAEFGGDSLAKLLKPEGAYDPRDEEWEFDIGSVVRYEFRQLGDQRVRVAVAAADNA